MDGHHQQTHELRRQIEWTLSRAVDPSDVLPMLHRLSRLAEDGSDESLFAHLHLAELLVERDPWRAALYARRVLALRPDDDRGWATLALCQTLLGNYKFAVSAYHNALTSAPKNPWYAHNLGHLLDVALDRARDAVGWLRRAYQTAAYSGEVSASYAHALARVGRLADARKVLARAMKRGSSREHSALLKWLDQGAPADKDHSLPRPAAVLQAMAKSAGLRDAADGRRPRHLSAGSFEGRRGHFTPHLPDGAAIPAARPRRRPGPRALVLAARCEAAGASQGAVARSSSLLPAGPPRGAVQPRERPRLPSRPRWPTPSCTSITCRLPRPRWRRASG